MVWRVLVVLERESLGKESDREEGGGGHYHWVGTKMTHSSASVPQRAWTTPPPACSSSTAPGEAAGPAPRPSLRRCSRLAWARAWDVMAAPSSSSACRCPI